MATSSDERSDVEASPQTPTNPCGADICAVPVVAAHDGPDPACRDIDLVAQVGIVVLFRIEHTEEGPEDPQVPDILFREIPDVEQESQVVDPVGGLRVGDGREKDA